MPPYQNTNSSWKIKREKNWKNQIKVLKKLQIMKNKSLKKIIFRIYRLNKACKTS